MARGRVPAEFRVALQQALHTRVADQPLEPHDKVDGRDVSELAGLGFKTAQDVRGVEPTALMGAAPRCAMARRRSACVSSPNVHAANLRLLAGANNRRKYLLGVEVSGPVRRPPAVDRPS